MAFLGRSKTQSPVRGGGGVQHPVTDSPRSESSFHPPGCKLSSEDPRTGEGKSSFHQL